VVYHVLRGLYHVPHTVLAEHRGTTMTEDKKSRKDKTVDELIGMGVLCGFGGVILSVIVAVMYKSVFCHIMSFVFFITFIASVTLMKRRKKLEGKEDEQ